MREPDAAFADPRMAVLYDEFNDDRSDLDAYVAIASELEAASVLDVGCGTGSLAVRLASLGLEVAGVDPAAASLDVARGKRYADRVTWIDGDVTAAVSLIGPVDLALMTGNVAQVFVADDDWQLTLEVLAGLVSRGGWLVFETRRPEVRDWETWSFPETAVDLPDGRTALVFRTVTSEDLPLVSFESTTTIDGEVLRSTSTLRFRDRAEIEHDLSRHGFRTADVRDAPDRPGKEMVFLAKRD